MLIVLALMGCVLTDKLDDIDDSGYGIDSCQPLMTVQCHALDYDVENAGYVLCQSDVNVESSYAVVTCGYNDMDVGDKATVVADEDGVYTAYYQNVCYPGCRLTIEFSPAE